MRLAFALLVAVSTASFADGPGTRIRTGPAAPQAAGPAAERDLQRCDTMRGEARERCMREVRAAMRGDDRAHAGPGPEATGMGSGAGGTASTSGGTAPR